MSRILVGLDIESIDPCLKTKGKEKASGWSWKYNKGKVLCTALYYPSTTTVEVIAGLHNENCPYSEQERKEGNNKIISLLKNEEVSIVGANLQYDIGWLLHEYNMSTFEVKCRFIDVLQAEHLLDEFNKRISLEYVSKKYLRFGKAKANIEKWIQENVEGAKGDFRGYLEESPWSLLVEYVSGDAKNPVLIWEKQLVEIKRQGLSSRLKLEFDCILPTLQMTINGLSINKIRKDIICTELTDYMEKYASLFHEKFGEYVTKSFKPTSGKQIASLCDRMDIPYRDKITLKGYNGEKFSDYRDTDEAMKEVKKLVTGFRFVKSVPVAYVPHKMTERTCDTLTENGFMFTVNPNCDKKFFESQRENYEVIDIIANWKLALGILSKILGEEYNRFICLDNKVRPQFNITDTISFRYSSCYPNIQQVPSKGALPVINNNIDYIKRHYAELAKALECKDDKWYISFPSIVRSLFTKDKGKCYFKIDYNQIEYRLICNIAVGEGSKEVREEFNKNPYLDFHQYVVDLTGLTRKYAKNMSFGVAFGMGLTSMAESFGWTLERTEEISEQYHHHMPFVKPTLAIVGDVAKKRGYIKTVLGSRARLPNPNKSYTMLNRYTQGSGAEILKKSITVAYESEVWKHLMFHITVHDELGFSVSPTEEQIREAYRMSDIMAHSVELKIPLVAEIELGDNWNDVHTVSEWLELKEKNDKEWVNCTEDTKQCVMLCAKIEKERKDV